MTQYILTKAEDAQALVSNDNVYVPKTADVIFDRFAPGLFVDDQVSEATYISVHVDGLLYHSAITLNMSFVNQDGFGDPSKALGDFRVSVGQTGRIISSGFWAVEMSSAYAELRNLGEIWGLTHGVAFTDAYRPFLFNAGAIIGSGYDAVTLRDSAFFELVNTGTLTGASWAIAATDSIGSITNSGGIHGGIQYSGASDVTIINSGLIESADTGDAAISGQDLGNAMDADLVLVNSGTIRGAGGAIEADNKDDSLSNTGDIFGDVSLGGGADLVRNAGLIDGTLSLGEGDDVYRGRADGHVTGTILGEQGNDTLIGGALNDVMDGGGQRDTLRGRAGDDDLTGGAEGDYLYGGRGMDLLTGQGGNDQLFGGGDDDTLIGSAGRDRLNGQRGDDTLLGGPDKDWFIFNRNAGDDVVLDFQEGTDLIDLTAFGLNSNDNDDITLLLGAMSKTDDGAVLIEFDALGGSGSVVVNGMTFNPAFVLVDNFEF